MEGPTIITLGNRVDNSPETNNVRVATFEEAFGEYSNAKGKLLKKMRAKRTERRAARVANKQEKSATKLAMKQAKADTKRGKAEMRQETRNLRKTGRQQSRIQRRADRKTSRQDMRASQLQARQDRRMSRKEAKGARKMLQVQDEQDRENYALEQEGYRDELAPQTYDDGGYDDNSGTYDSGSTYDDGGYDTGASYDTGDNYAYDDAGASYDSGDDYDTSASYDDGYDAGYGGDVGGYEQYYFDGPKSMEDIEFDVDAEMIDTDDNSNSVDDVVVNPEIQDKAVRLEWNKEMISRLNKVTPSEKAEDAKLKANTRIATLSKELESYQNFDDYDMSSADGGEGNVEKVRGQRRMEVRKARRLANGQRPGVRGLKGRGKGIGRGRGRKAMQVPVTPVEGSLNAEISSNQIVVPPAGSAFNGYGNGLGTGTGIIGIDNQDDYGYNDIDVQLGADGSSSLKDKITSNKTRNILIGVAIGVVAVVLIRKYKLLSKLKV